MSEEEKDSAVDKSIEYFFDYESEMGDLADDSSFETETEGRKQKAMKHVMGRRGKQKFKSKDGKSGMELDILDFEDVADEEDVLHSPTPGETCKSKAKQCLDAAKNSGSSKAGLGCEFKEVDPIKEAAAGDGEQSVSGLGEVNCLTDSGLEIEEMVDDANPQEFGYDLDNDNRLL